MFSLIRVRWLFLLLALFSVHAAATDLTPVKLQLKWQHQFQFAGYYAALSQGFYRQAGLDVTLLEAHAGQDSIQCVLDGKAEFGVGTSELLLHYREDDPVVILAAIMQHSPLALATLKSSVISNIHQVASQPLMLEPNSSELMAYLKNEGVDLERLQLVEHSHEIHDLIDGKVKVMSIYTTDETYEFEQKGLKYQLFRPVMSGIDFYGDNLFTTQAMIDQHPKLVEAFRQASLQGWKYAMQHPEEIADLILSDYSQRKSREHLLYEAGSMRELMKPDLVEIGYINPGRWQQIAYTYAQLGLLPETFDAGAMIYQTSDSAYQKLKQRLYYVVGGLVFMVLLAAIFYRQYHLANIRREQFQGLFENAPISLLEMDTDGVIHNWNKEAENTFHYSAKEAIGQNAFDLIVPQEEANSVNRIVDSAWASKQVVQLENTNVRKDGRRLLCQWSNMPFETEHKNEMRVISMARDITLEKEMEEKLYYAAHYDELTGLPNRSLVLNLLKEALADAKRHQTEMAILFIDLNDFKAINDTHGHLAGDEVIIQTANRIQQTVRESDLVGRLSGDEFLVVIKDLKSEEHLATVKTKIAEAIEQGILIEALRLTITASIGASLYPRDAEDIQQLISIADQAMYKVKAAYKENKG